MPVITYDELDPGIKEIFKVPRRKMKRIFKKPGSIQCYVIDTDTHRYTWTLIRSRMQFAVRKVPIRRKGDE